MFEWRGKWIGKKKKQEMKTLLEKLNADLCERKAEGVEEIDAEKISWIKLKQGRM